MCRPGCRPHLKSHNENGSDEPFSTTSKCASRAHFQSAFVNDVRTRYQARDPALLKLIENVRKVKRLVEEGIEDPHKCQDCAPPMDPIPLVAPLMLREPRPPRPKKK